MYIPTYFSIDEYVCPHVYNKYGLDAWTFFDVKLLITMDWIREHLGKPVYMNDWMIHGKYSQRGFRCIQCSLVRKAIREKILYVSAHMTGQAGDFNVPGMESEEVRQWLKSHEVELPYPIRLEEDTSWVHIDTRDAGKGKIYFFKP